MGQAADEHAIGGEIIGPQLDMGLGKKTVSLLRDLIKRRQGIIFFRILKNPVLQDPAKNDSALS